MKEFFWNHDSGVKLIFIAVLIFVGFNLFYLNKKIGEIGGIREGAVEKASEALAGGQICGEECKKIVDEKISAAIATISGQKKTTTVFVKEKQEPKTTFVPLGGSFSTQGMDWTDVKNSEVSVKIEDYGNDPYVEWNAFLKVTSGNGTAYARLYDVTHGTAVDGSELSSSSDSFVQTTSGKIKLWSGNNLYRVQIKSLNGFTVYFDSGRLKIVSK